MASESAVTMFAEPRRSYEENKEDKVKEGVEYKEDKNSEILEGLPVVNASNASDLPVDVIPDGGFTAWMTVFGVFLIQFCGFGYAASFGVYQDFYTQNYLVHESSSAISWIGSTNVFLVQAVCLISGSLYDRGYFYHIVIAGSLLQSFSLFMLSLVQPNQYYQIFLAQGICSGLGSGLTFIPSIAVISHHFRRRRVLVMGLAVSGSALGSIVHPIMLNNLLNGPVGFANGVRASAGLVSGLLVIACLCMRTRLPPPKTPVNYIAVAKKCVHDVPLLFMIAGGFFFQIGYFYPLFFLQLDAVEHGVSNTFSFYSLVILNAANLVGRVSSGFIAERIGVPSLEVIATLSCGIITLGMIPLNSVASVVVIAVLYGYFSGIYIAMYTPLMVTLTTDFSELGGRMGICSFISAFGVLIGSPIAGALLTSNYIWWAPAVFAGLTSLAGCMLYGIMLVLFVRRQKKQAMES